MPKLAAPAAPKRAPRSHSHTPEQWEGLISRDGDLGGLDDAGRLEAWSLLAWAEKKVKLPVAPPVTSLEDSEASRLLRTVLAVLSAPPATVEAAERVRLAAGWAGRLNHPLLHALHGVRALEAGQVRPAVEVFERLKCVGSAFPEVPLTAGRALLQAAGSDVRLLHRAEWYLKHAEHLYLEGPGEEAPEEEAECSDDPEPMEHEVSVEPGVQDRLAEIWGLMASLYDRLGDPRKGEMYRSRAGDCLEEREDADEGAEACHDFVDQPGLKPSDRKLIQAFFSAPQLTSLRASEQQQARTAVPCFVALGRMYLGLAPTRLDRYSLEELLLALIPEKIVASMDEMGRIPSVLTAWIAYLGKSAGLREAGRLVPLVHRLGADYMRNCRNRDCWGVPKARAMRAMASGEAPGGCLLAG